METSKMEKLYQNISDKVGSMIPEEWNKVYFYGEIFYIRKNKLAVLHKEWML